MSRIAPNTPQYLGPAVRIQIQDCDVEAGFPQPPVGLVHATCLANRLEKWAAAEYVPNRTAFRDRLAEEKD
jgi:hypothetical protein